MAGRKIQLLLSPGQEVRFIETLRNSYEDVYQVLGDLDMRSAECFDISDKEKIKSANTLDFSIFLLIAVII